MSKKWFVCIVFLTHLTVSGQVMTSEEIKIEANKKFTESLYDLKDFLKIANDGHYPDQVKNNLDRCTKIFEKLDFTTKVLTTDGAPLLFAQREFHKKAKTLLFYLQIDGQPVDTSAWNQPDPYVAVLKEERSENEWQTIPFDTIKQYYNPEWRLFARSVSDSKGPAMALISALQIMQTLKMAPQFNIKVLMDFQEELGSPDLAGAVIKNRELLLADALLIMDGTRHISNWPTLTYGARGIATATLKIFGPKEPLHSGQYGNYAPNPVFEASRLIGSLKDDEGKVTLNGFYDGIVLSEKEKAMLKSLPENEDSLRSRLGISSKDAVGNNYQEALQYPSLNVRGLQAGWVGKEVRTLIPNEVIIEFDMRLVPETEGERLMGLLKNHIVEQGYFMVDSIPTDRERQLHSKLASFTYKLGSLPFRTDMDSSLGWFLNSAMQKVFGEKVVNMRTTGGSQPIAPFISTLDVAAVSVRIPNPDNNIHAPNENLGLGNYLEGIITCLAILNERF